MSRGEWNLSGWKKLCVASKFLPWRHRWALNNGFEFLAAVCVGLPHPVFLYYYIWCVSILRFSHLYCKILQERCSLLFNLSVDMHFIFVAWCQGTSDRRHKLFILFDILLAKNDLLLFHLGLPPAESMVQTVQRYMQSILLFLPLAKWPMTLNSWYLLISCTGNSFIRKGITFLQHMPSNPSGAV